ncbi:MAG: fructose-1,6-bisphosphatase [Coriobacteriia bacterium]|nr:fructose-1,6-bisphosphatase [Coriobacteriia bacterium]
MTVSDQRYLELLSQQFPTSSSAAAEIINLSAILNLPKGTEFYASDIHGEYESFSHVLRNASGSIRLKIDEVFASRLSEAEKKSLATLIYYPKEKMRIELAAAEDPKAWYADAISKLITVCRHVGRKYTRSKVRKAFPKDFQYVVEELLTENRYDEDKEAYYHSIGEAVIRTGSAEGLIEALCLAIQNLAIDQLHIVGDIFDRGPAPHTIMDMLIKHPSVDIQWGNHDIVWMGAAVGQWGCIAHVVRNCSRYGNLSILEDAYGINILPLAGWAKRAYENDPCVAFGLKGNPQLTDEEHQVSVKIQKAMAIIQFKVEGQLIDRYPSFDMQDRKLLHHIDHEKGTITLDGVEYELTDKEFPTVDPANPYQLTEDEERVMARLEQAFKGSEKLQRHVAFLLEAGSLYKICNGCLLVHACVPLNADGTPKEVDVFGKRCKGRELYQVLENYIRAAFKDPDSERRRRGQDLIWWLWLGDGSPLFAKSKMATFENYFVNDKAARKEDKNPFYKMLDNEDVIKGIFREFDMDPETSRIVCGHVPVKVKDGEDPIKCNGRVLTIDGGFSKAYQPTTGIAGYTLISNSYGFILASHEPFESAQAAVENEQDICSTRQVVEQVEKRTLVCDTDKGAQLQQQIDDLKRLMTAYREGTIPERE